MDVEAVMGAVVLMDVEAVMGAVVLMDVEAVMFQQEVPLEPPYRLTISI
jgi:hypothetical protein